MAKNTFRSKTFAGNSWASGTFNGIGVTIFNAQGAIVAEAGGAFTIGGKSAGGAFTVGAKSVGGGFSIGSDADGFAFGVRR